MDSRLQGMAGGLAVLAAVLVGWQGGKAMARAHYQRQINDPAAIVRAVAAAINKRAPQQIDSETRLDNATGVGDRLTYYYTLPRISASQLDLDTFREEIIPTLRNRMCTGREPAFLLSKGVKVTLAYRDRTGRQFSEVPLQAQDCAGVL